MDKRFGLVLGAMVWLVAGCSSESEDTVVTPSCGSGAIVACGGPDGCAGTQACRADGQGYEACVCGAIDSSVPPMDVATDTAPEVAPDGTLADSTPNDTSSETLADVAADTRDGASSTDGGDAFDANAFADVAIDSAPDVSAEVPLNVFEVGAPDAFYESGLPVSGCHECTKTSCTTELAACNADDRCRRGYACSLGCLGASDRQACNQGCIAEIGLDGGDDPVLSLLVPVGNCQNALCSAPCALQGSSSSDGGISPADGGGAASGG